MHCYIKVVLYKMMDENFGDIQQKESWRFCQKLKYGVPTANCRPTFDVVIRPFLLFAEVC
jgi:hypothetical protein